MPKPDSITLWDMPLARTKDPISSHQAVDEIKSSGTHAEQCNAVAAAVTRWPGRTSAELAHLMAIERHIPGRRLPDLEFQARVYRGPIRPCTVCLTKTGAGRPCVTWYPTSRSNAAGA